MLSLRATTDILRVNIPAAGDVRLNAAAVIADSAAPPAIKALPNLGPTAAQTGTGNVTVVDTSGGTSGDHWNVKQFSAKNAHASVSQPGFRVEHFDGSNTDICWEGTLLPKEKVEYDETGHWAHYDADGHEYPSVINSDALLTGTELGGQQTILMPQLDSHPTLHTFVGISGTAYYVYLGRAAKAMTVDFVEFHVTTAGAGAQTAEVGVFSTPLAPNRAAQTLTKLVATGTVDSLTTTGMKRNTSGFGLAVAKGTHLWAAVRTAMATTQPTYGGLASDMSEGHILTTTGGGALTGLSSASGGLVAIATVTVAPALRGVRSA